MKKIVISIVGIFMIAGLIVAAFGARHARHLLDFRPREVSSESIPPVAWIDAAASEAQDFLMYDLHRVDGFPFEIDIRPFSKVEGWSDRAGAGTWTVGRRAVVDFRLSEVEPRTLVLNNNPTKGLFEPTQRALVTLNEHPLGRVRISDLHPLSVLKMPAAAQVVGRNRLVFEFDQTVRPVDRSRGTDERQLAAWFRSITILNGSFGHLGASARLIGILADKKGRTKAALIDSKGRLAVRGPGTIVAAADPRGANHLGVVIRPPVTAERLTVSAHDLNGGRAPAVVSLVAHNTSTDVTIEIPDDIDCAFLEIELQAEDDAQTFLAADWLTDAGPISEQNQTRAETTFEKPLNIVVLVLDAARPDRFGCYGGSRPATPYIDALAKDSLIFSDVVALAPYTLCSVPTMVTGLSFLDHGVVDRGHRLADEATTLAEVLADAGYQTAAFSATPNNSRKIGTAQGYEIFEEAWRGVDRGPALDPHRLVDMATKWLDEQPSNQPFHLQLHMVPPHEPYEPGPSFDRFSDPEYHGPANGSRAFIDRFNEDKSGISLEDIDHVNALYDGNLLKADDAVGRLLETLRKRSDWRRTVVLVTSDHGEALGEHGRIGHNEHVFDEMIRVPFILRLPDSVAPEGINPSGISASLADLAPTLAALAGREFPGTITGRNLLAPESGRPRAFVLRNAGDKPVYGLRTSRWKLVVWGTTDFALYDPLEDPEELNDLAAERPVVTAGLRQIVMKQFAAPRLLAAATESELSDQDEEMLRTLGYLE